MTKGFYAFILRRKLKESQQCSREQPGAFSVIIFYILEKVAFLKYKPVLNTQ